MKTQIEAVLNHLKEHGTITSMEAIVKYGATRLSDIIFRLRRNHNIDMIRQESEEENRYGKKSHYGLYIYKGEKNTKTTDNWYWHYFEDNYRCCSRGFDETELAVEERKHGKLVHKEKAEI